MIRKPPYFRKMMSLVLTDGSVEDGNFISKSWSLQLTSRPSRANGLRVNEDCHVSAGSNIWANILSLVSWSSPTQVFKL